jgi:hypothetical protein
VPWAFAAVGLLCASTLNPVRADEHIGAATLVVNNVTGALGQAQTPTILRAGIDVFQNEVIVTGENSASLLVFRDKTELSVGAESKVALDRFVFDPNPAYSAVAVSIAKGVARFTTGTLSKSAYTINTPSATLAIRGTVLNIFVASTGATTLDVESGTAFVSAHGQTRTVNAGQSVLTRLGTPPGPPFATPPPSRNATQMSTLLHEASLHTKQQNASNSATPQQKVAAILAQFPNGGRELSDAIAKAVEADPSLAGAFVAAALTANPAQQKAIGGGLAEAVVYFANNGSDPAKAAQQEIQAAMASAPGATLFAFISGGGATTALAALLGTGGPVLTTNTCISPSRPGQGC